jgi:hypothetical protein
MKNAVFLDMKTSCGSYMNHRLHLQGVPFVYNYMYLTTDGQESPL